MLSFYRAARICAPLALLLSAAHLSAQDAERMEQVVSASANDGTFMGAALVAVGDRILLNKAYGSANLEWDVANTTSTKFRIGSVTKQFTAAAILLLQERGQLDIDHPIKTYLKNMPASYDAITVRHLLHHTSGIPHVTAFDEFANWKYLPTKRDDLIAKFTDRELEFTPGSKWNYSNSGYLLLTAIVEDVSGMGFQEFARKELFAPLGMDDTAIDVTSDIVRYRASGYSPSASGVVNADYVDMGIPQGAGALYSTTHDLLKWNRGLFGGKILKPETVAMMSAPAVAAFPGSFYAMGLIDTQDKDGRLISHGGGIEGFNSFLAYDPDREISVVVLTNLNGGAANQLGLSLVTLARGGTIELASERVAISTDGVDLAQYEGDYAVNPQFVLKFFVEDGQLMTQATGQSAFPVFAKGPDEFFLKVVDARLRFNRDADGRVTSVTLFQNGQEIPAQRQ